MNQYSSLHVLNIFRTTNDELFLILRENAMEFDKLTQKSLMVSTVVHGDADKVKMPASEMRGNYFPNSVDHITSTRYYTGIKKDWAP